MLRLILKLISEIWKVILSFADAVSGSGDWDNFVGACCGLIVFVGSTILISVFCTLILYMLN